MKKENVFLVGGAVRDKLLKIKSNDFDYVVINSSKEEMEKNGFKGVGSKFQVFIHPETKEEYALARKEKSTGDSYHDFECDYDNVSLEDDLARRDLTINSIAEDHLGNIIDPFNGQEDLKNKVLKHTTKEFETDPLRLIRLARFYSKFDNFTVDEETIKLCHNIVKNNLLSSVSDFKLGEQMLKSLKSKKPSRFFYFLKKVNALEILFPEFYNLIGQTQREEYHPEGDSFIHTMLVLDKARELTDDPMVLLACLTHDLGKALTPKEELPRHHGHEKAGIPLVENFCKRFNLSKKQRKFSVYVCKNHLKVHRVTELRSAKLYRLLKELRIFQAESDFDKLLICFRADNLGKNSDKYISEDYIRDIKKVLLEEKPSNVKNYQMIEQFYINKINQYFKDK